MAVRPLLANDVGEGPGDSDDHLGMDEMMEEFEQGGPGEDSRHRDPGEGPPGPQVTERSVAAGSGPIGVRERSEVELEQEGFYGSRKPRLLGEPYVPTEQEIEEHNKSHLPWRPWCASCVDGGAVSQPHHPTPDDPLNSRLPHVLMDYFFMGQDDSKVLPMIGLKERQCKMKFAHMVEEKGPNEDAID